MRNFSVIVAIAQDGGIGRNNELPWKLKEDMKFFRTKTTETRAEEKRNAVIMGKNTWLSIPQKFRPLSKRLNIVLSSTLSPEDVPEGVIIAKSLVDSLTLLNEKKYLETIDTVFCIGGGMVYEEALKLKTCEKLYVTRVQGSFNCDRFFPAINEQCFNLVTNDENKNDYNENQNNLTKLVKQKFTKGVENGIEFEFCEYNRV